jgi:hypothetical protein
MTTKLPGPAWSSRRGGERRGQTNRESQRGGEGPRWEQPPGPSRVGYGFFTTAVAEVAAVWPVPPRPVRAVSRKTPAVLRPQCDPGRPVELRCRWFRGGRQRFSAREDQTRCGTRPRALRGARGVARVDRALRQRHGSLVDQTGRDGRRPDESA